MQVNIRTSEANQEIVKNLTTKLALGTKENVVARIALGYSLQSGKRFSQNEFNVYDSKGKEYKDHILFEQRHRDFYIALICQHYGIYKTHESIPKYIKLHIDHGLELMYNTFQSSHNTTLFDFLMVGLEKGLTPLETISVSLDHVRNNNQGIEKSFFSDPININVGCSLSEEPIIVGFNDTSIYNNNHMAVAGNSGTGKTQFALQLLREISEKSNHQVNFIYLDFKGLQKDDVAGLQAFFESTKATFISAPQVPFPVNPLTFIDCINETDKLMGIDKFVDIVGKYSNLGVKQSGILREATITAFRNMSVGKYPTMANINKCLLDLVDEKRDSLTEIMDHLSRYELFKEDAKNTHFLNRNVYLSLSGDLPNSVRFTSLFLIINYIYNTFMNMENTPVENGMRAMRYVLLIDEAHVIFNEKKYHGLLEKILREIRSKGVSVVLLSQGIREFNQSSFDFSSMCEMSFMLDVKDKTDSKAIKKFLGLGDTEIRKAARSLEEIKSGQAVANIKEHPKAELFNVSQFWKS